MFLAFGWFRFDGESTLRPLAANAPRWAPIGTDMRKFLRMLVVLSSVILTASCARVSHQLSIATVTSTPADEVVTATPLPIQPPTQISSSASWIEVDLAKQIVVLHESGAILAEYAASTGITSESKYATPAGLYHVQSKEKGPIESVPGVFVSDVIMFDIFNGNGIHSRPMDKQGEILDTTLGQPATAGCVRVGESVSVFEFAKLGMWVWIH